MRKKYLLLLLVALAMALGGCKCDKKHVAPPPAPSAPSNLSGSAVSSTEIDLAWKDNSTNEKGFYVYRRTTDNYSRVAIMEANATSYNDTGLDPETSYWYKVRAYNDGGESGSSNEVNITTPAGLLPPLQPPSNVMAEAVSYKQINLSWRDNSDDEDHFRIACDMGLGNGHNQLLVRLPANTTRYEHCNLQPMREYRYFVIAGRGGESAASERFSATTPCPVTILNLWCKYYSNPAWVEVRLYNQAVEIAQVELTIGIYDGANLLTIIVEEVAIEGLGTLWFQNFYELDQGVYATRCTADITDVEIEY